MTNLKSFLTSMAMVALSIAIQSCNQSTATEERNKASVITGNEELFNKGNVIHAENLFTSDYAGKGPDFVKEVVSGMKAAFPDLQVSVNPIIADGDMAAWFRTNTGTHKNDFMGYQATGKKVTWTDVVITRFTPEGKIVEEWWQSGMAKALETSSGLEGVYEYLPPLKGQSSIRNGKFVFLYGSADGKGPMTGQAGTYTISGDIVESTFNYSTNLNEIGTKAWWRQKSWSGDTVTYEILNDNGEITGGGRAVRISN